MLLINIMEQQIHDLKQQLDQQVLVNQQQLLDAQQQQQVAQEQLQNAQTNSFHQGYRKRKAEENDFKEDLYRSEFQKLRMELRSQGATSLIPQFSGESSEKYTAWVKNLERVLAQLGGDDTRAQILALQTTSGPAGDYVTRVYNEKPDTTWEELKKKLKARYSDLADLTYARIKLRRLTQMKSETVQNFHERVLSTAQDVFDADKLKQKHVEEELVQHFIDGLNSDVMARRLIRLKVTSMEKALEHALAEQQAQKSFDLRRGPAREEEPMEVDSLSVNASGELSKVTGLLQELLSQLKSQHSVPNDLQPRNGRGQFVGNRNRECYRCHRRGHIAAQCRMPHTRNDQNFNRNGMNNQPPHNTRQPTYAQVAARPPRNEYYGRPGNM